MTSCGLMTITAGADEELFTAEGAEDARTARTRRLVSLWRGRGGTYTQNRRLVGLARPRLPEGALVDAPEDLRAAIPSHAVVVAPSPHPHGEIPAAHLTEVLGALGLPARGQ